MEIIIIIVILIIIMLFVWIKYIQDRLKQHEQDLKILYSTIDQQALSEYNKETIINNEPNKETILNNEPMDDKPSISKEINMPKFVPSVVEDVYQGKTDKGEKVEDTGVKSSFTPSEKLINNKPFEKIFR